LKQGKHRIIPEEEEYDNSDKSHSFALKLQESEKLPSLKVN